MNMPAFSILLLMIVLWKAFQLQFASSKVCLAFFSLHAPLVLTLLDPIQRVVDEPATMSLTRGP